MEQDHLVTGDDGTKFEVMPDGTLRKVQPLDEGRLVRPLTWEEMRDRPPLAIAAVEGESPKDLTWLCPDLSQLTRRGFRFIERGAAELDATATPAYRPAWLSPAVRPKAALRAPAPRVQHRGVELDPLVVWGADDRRIYNDTSYPWGCVCRIITAFGRVGSGVLIGPRHVLTASHVIEWSTDLAETVEVHRAGGTVSAIARATNVWSFTQIGSVTYSTVDEDYAVIVTDQRLGDRFGWMGARTYDSGWDDEKFWFNIGYPTDIANGLSPVWQNRQSMDEDEFDLGSGRAMTTTADMKKGQSGGPMFAFWRNPNPPHEDQPFAVAVASADGVIFLSGLENWCSGGSDLTRLVNHARRADP